MPEDHDDRCREHRDQLLVENRRLAQRCLELESAARRQVEKLRAANAVLSRGEADLRALLDNSAIGFALIDLNLRVAAANKALSDILGYQQNELTGVNFGNFIYVGKLPAFSRLTSRYGGKRKGNDIIELVTRDGALLPSRMAVSDWLDDEGALRGHFLLVFDAGPELVAAGRLREMEENMAEAEKSRNLFLDVMSRELHSPAAGIMGMSRMLMEAGLDERQMELASVIHTSASSLVRLVDDLVYVVRVDTGEARENPVPVSPAGLVRGAMNLFSVRAEEKGLDLRVNIGSKVPELVIADPSLLRRVLVHLLDNSLKFTEHGHVVLSVDVVGEKLRFMVSDTGPGVEPEAEEDLLGEGIAHDMPVARRHGGIGVGLAVCRRLVTLMGGRISYESKPGAGSEFHFNIPLALPDKNEAAKAIEPPVEAVQLPRLSILLADVNPLSNSMIRAYLNFDGHALTIADSGVEAAEKCMDKAFDLVILDLNLPKLDGLQTLRLIRENEKAHATRRVPVLLLVSPGQKRETGHYLRAGADGVVRKPVQPVDLMAAAAAATGVQPLAVSRLKGPTQYVARAGGSSIRRLDGSQLVNLRQVMPEEQFVGILRFFMEDAVPGLIDIQRMAEQVEPDPDRIVFAASKSRGLAAYLGFSALAELLERIERCAKDCASPEELRALAGEIPVVTDDSLEELKRIIPEAFATMSEMREKATEKDDVDTQ